MKMTIILKEIYRFKTFLCFLKIFRHLTVYLDNNHLHSIQLPQRCIPKLLHLNFMLSFFSNPSLLYAKSYLIFLKNIVHKSLSETEIFSLKNKIS